MKNTLGDLNNYLFEALERVTDDTLSPEELDTELKRCDSITSIAEAIVRNGELAFKAIKHADEWGKSVPPMLGGTK